MEIHQQEPSPFFPKWQICGVVVQHREKILLLRRHPDKSYGNHWNLPAGKMEEGETTRLAAARELKEESGIDIQEEALNFLGTLFFKTEALHFTFHLYYFSTDQELFLQLSEEETVEGKWWDWNEKIDPLIPGGTEVLDFCKSKISDLNV